MKYIYYYLIIGALYGFPYVAWYINSMKEQFKAANKKQMIGIVLISFVMITILYPIDLVDRFIKIIKTRRTTK